MNAEQENKLFQSIGNIEGTLTGMCAKNKIMHEDIKRKIDFRVLFSWYLILSYSCRLTFFKSLTLNSIL